MWNLGIPYFPLSPPDDHWKWLLLTPIVNENHKHQYNGVYLYYHQFPSLFPPCMSCLSVNRLSSEPLVSAHQVVRFIKTILHQPSTNAFITFAPVVVHQFHQACRQLTGTWTQQNVSPTASLVAKVAYVSPIMVVVHRR